MLAKFMKVSKKKNGEVKKRADRKRNGKRKKRFEV